MVFVETSFPRGGVAKQINENDASKPDIVSVKIHPLILEKFNTSFLI